ncbi:GNAT family N-acetyltransferase [Pelobium sp.]|nr:GNAT family N-acetyltransferase [Pelobium sp.]MDA9554850.1 GNAT family N-acetyltransferase [Pelobium sp.]
MELIPCDSTKLNDLAYIAKKAYQDHYLYLWEDDGAEYLRNNFEAEVLAKELEDSNALFYLVKEAKELLGFVKINLHEALAPYSAKEALELERIYLIREATAKGFGKQIIQFTQQLAKDLGKHVLWLKSMDSAPALQFYLSQGFEIIGQQTLPYPQMKVEYRTLLTLKKML